MSLFAGLLILIAMLGTIVWAISYMIRDMLGLINKDTREDTRKVKWQPEPNATDRNTTYKPAASLDQGSTEINKGSKDKVQKKKGTLNGPLKKEKEEMDM